MKNNIYKRHIKSDTLKKITIRLSSKCFLSKIARNQYGYVLNSRNLQIKPD